MGKTIEKETYVTSEKQKLEHHDKTYQPIINHLHQFFTQVISTNSPKIASLVEQHEFTKAWHQLLVEELVTRDTTQSIITLNHNILQLTYDTTKDSDFNQFYDRFTRTHALYLFKLWHQHLSFETIRYILSDLTDDKFISYLKTHHPNLTPILTRLPDQVNYNARAIQLQRAITGSHLQSSLTTYLQTSELDLLSLVQILRQADPNITNLSPITHLDRKTHIVNLERTIPLTNKNDTAHHPIITIAHLAQRNALLWPILNFAILAITTHQPRLLSPPSHMNPITCT